MTGHPCPRCRGALVPLRYGFPSGETTAAARRGEVALGGCTATGDDPRWRCPACRLGVYPGGVFAADEDAPGGPRLAVVLAPAAGPPGEASVDAAGALALGPFTVPAGDAPTVDLMLMVQRFGGGADVAAWLAARGVPHRAAGSGPFAGVAVGDEVVLRLAGGEVAVPRESAARVVLGCLADVIADGTFSGVDDLAGWLAEHGVEVLPARGG